MRPLGHTNPINADADNDVQCKASIVTPYPHFQACSKRVSLLPSVAIAAAQPPPHILNEQQAICKA